MIHDGPTSDALLSKLLAAQKDVDRLDWLESQRRCGAYVDFDQRGGSIRLDSSLPMSDTIRAAIDLARNGAKEKP